MIKAKSHILASGGVVTISRYVVQKSLELASRRNLEEFGDDN